MEIARVELEAYKAAYTQERSTRLQDSSNYVYTINTKDKALNELKEALKIEQAMPKTEVIVNPDWWKFGLGGAAIGALVYFVIENLVINK